MSLVRLLLLPATMEREATTAASGLELSPTSTTAVMGSSTPHLHPDDRLVLAADLMRTFGLRELPVVDERDYLAGILSQTDLLPYRGHFEWTQVRTAMTPDPITIGPRTAIREAVQLLLDRRINALPVVDGGALVGMLRRVDLLPLLLSRTT